LWGLIRAVIICLVRLFVGAGRLDREVQGVTVCAQLLSPQQMERLENTYPFAQFRAESVLDLFIILVKPEQAAPATYQADLYEAAKRLAPLLAAEPSVAARRIAFIEARWDGQLELRLAALGSTPKGH
jgi:hypothetical protein